MSDAPELRLRLTWELGEAEVAYHTTVNGERWTIVVNDFPDEQMYSLFVAGLHRVTFDNWPSVWKRPKSS